jgi:hypothetical protein
MSEKRLFILANPEVRRRAAAFIVETAPDGYVVTVKPPLKSREQEERFHAMVGDVARQVEIHGRKFDEETVKRLVIDQFRRDTARDPELAPLWASIGQMDVVPSLDGSGVVAIGWQSRRFPKKLYSALIEWLFAYGAEEGVEWTDPTARKPQEATT